MKDGRRIRQSLETGDFEVAGDVMIELRSKVVKGKWDLLDNRYPWEQLKKDFLAWAKQHVRGWKVYKSNLEKFEGFCHIRCVSMVSPQLIDKFREQRLAEGVVPRTINKQVGTISNYEGRAVVQGAENQSLGRY